MGYKITRKGGGFVDSSAMVFSFTHSPLFFHCDYELDGPYQKYGIGFGLCDEPSVELHGDSCWSNTDDRDNNFGKYEIVADNVCIPVQLTIPHGTFDCPRT